MSARIKEAISTLALLGLVLGAMPAVGQEITGSIVGIVKDANGAVVAGATVTIKSTEKNIVVRTINTNEEGTYSAPFLPVGRYSVTVEATGFKKFIKTDIELNVNARIAIDASLEAGAVNEEVVVTAGAVQVETQTATAAGLISGIEMRELPLNNRNFVQLVTLMPGVSNGMSDQPYIGVSNPNSGSVNTVSIAINGGRSSQNNWTIDGADNVDRGSNLTLLNYPSVDAIAEFKVLRNHYSAEYGRNAAGHVNVITKSGTSRFRGSAYEFFRNDKLNANTFLNNASGRFTTDPTAKAPDLIVPAGDPREGTLRVPRQVLRYNNFGYTIGGPVYIPGAYNKDKSKTFFFWSEEFRRVITYANFNATVPTATQRQGIFATPVCVQLNAAGTACAQTATQIANINPAAAAYLKDIYANVPLPQTGNTLITNVRNIFNHRQELLRVDHNFSERFTLAVRYLHDEIPTEEPGGIFGPNSVLPGVATSNTNSPGYSWVARSVQTLTPTMTNEVGYAFSYGAIVSRISGLVAAENSPDVVKAIKLPFTPTLARIPSVSPGFSGIAGFGPYDDFNRNHNVYDNFTKILGRHTMKAGTSIHFYQKTENAASTNAGSFSFGSTGTPTGTSTTLQQWANFLLGNVSTFTQASQDLFPDIHARQYEFYVQDDFRIKSNLTFNMGLRYSRFRQPFDKSGQLTNFDPSLYDPAKAVQINAANGNVIPGTGDPVNGLAVAGKNSRFGNKVTNEDNNDFAPVIGFAWDPFKDGKTAIRGGYGLSYDSVLFGIVEQNIFTNPPYVSSISISSTRLDDPGSGVPTISAAAKNLRGTPFDYDTPYVQQWSLDVQREVFRNFILDVGYFGSKGTHLLGIVDLNLVPPGAAIAAGLQTVGQPVTTGTPTAKLNAIRPYKGYISINAPQTWFNSTYNSLQVASEKRWKDGSVVRVAYTFSKNLTDNQSDRSNAPQTFYNRALDKGLASLDRRQIFTLSYVYQLPFFKKQEGLMGRAFGGWQLSGIMTTAAGVPLTVTTANTDPAGLGFLGPSASGPRPDVLRNPALGSGLRTRFQWFDTTAFAEVPIGQNRVGTSGRGVVRGPGYQRWDLTLGKRFKITEGVSFQFRGEMYNLFNHTNLSGVQTARTSLQFGQITSFRDPRVAQIGLKVIF